MSDNKGVQNIIEKSFQDPISELLLKRSSLTKAQFETLIIDMLIDSMSDENVSFKEKTAFRTRKVSRGSFSRTLGQARTNVISSIYTIILLSYIGVFESSPFEEYQMLTEKLREYLTVMENSDASQKKQHLKRIESELLEGIDSLSKPTSIKIM